MREHETEGGEVTKVSDLVDGPFKKDQNSQEEEGVWGNLEMGGGAFRHVEFVLLMGPVSGHMNDRLGSEKRPD